MGWLLGVGGVSGGSPAVLRRPRCGSPRPENFSENHIHMSPSDVTQPDHAETTACGQFGEAGDMESSTRRLTYDSSMKPRSLTGETLLRVAIGVTLIVALSSGITYWLIYSQLELRALERLQEYSLQRTQLHEARFGLGKAFHEVIKADLIRRYQQGMPAASRRFDALMMRYPDGAWRNRPEYSDITRYSTGWIHKDVQLDEELQRRWMLFFDVSEHYSRLVTSRFVNFYVMHPTKMLNMGYDDPERSGHLEWVKSTPADYAMNEREFFSAAGVTKNPQRQTVWAGPYYEPAYKQILVSALTPVYVGDEHIATIGSDDLLGDLEARILHSDIPGASHTVFRKDGRLVVDPKYMKRIVESHNGFSIDESRDVRLETLWKLALQSADAPLFGYAKDIDQFYSIGRLSSTGWYFASTLPGHVIRAQAFRAVQWVLWTGAASMALLIASLALILRRQIARPLRRLQEGIRSAAAGEGRAVPTTGSEELGHMADAFNSMLSKVSERDAALRDEKERFRALIEHAADVIVVVAADGAVLYTSPAAQTVLGLAPDALLGRPLLAEVHPDDRDGLAAALLNVVGHPGAVVERTEFRMRHADGTWRWLQATGTNQIGNSAVTGIVINARDITAAKDAEAQIVQQRENLHQREKLAAMGSLLAGVAHELNNPLSIVVGRATMLQEEAIDEGTRTIADKIRAAAERCARIVRTFLAMARQRKPEQTVLSINAVLTDCVEMLGYGLRTAGVTVEKQLAVDLPSISGNADQLHQVFLNLIVNAQQAMETQPLPRRLRIVSDQHDGRVRIRIADNGPGVAPAIRSRIFDPYFTTKPPGGGTGVGLAVSLGIVESHNGSLTVDCPPEGGAVFQVLFPIQSADQQPDQPQTSLPEAVNPKGPRLLIVDDEPEVGALLADILRRDAATIEVAASGREALQRMSEREFEAILTDLRMPEMDGLELYRQIEQRWPERARLVVFITGDALSPTVQKFLAGTGQPYLEKPFVPAEVRKIVQDIVVSVPLRQQSASARS
jgi:PAS domain S-box-containing protein